MVRTVWAILASCCLSAEAAAQAQTYSFRTAQECRDVVGSERKRWDKEYWEMAGCWGKGRCGNPGADPRLTRWFNQNQALSEQCSEMGRRERDAQQAVAES